MRQERSLRLGMLWVVLLAWSGTASAQHWNAAPKASFKPGSTALLLTDGTIMVQEFESANWWKLTPDDHANYNTGTWSKLASAVAFNPTGGIEPYAPRLYASAVLPDGRVIIEGGEYEYATGAVVKWTNKGAIFDPTAGPIGAWTPMPAPPAPTIVDPFATWKQIGDAPSVVLADGTFMLGNINNKQVALLDAKKLKWTVVSGPTKCDRNSEEGWTLLPNDTVLTVDVFPCSLPNNSEVFNPGADPTTGTWSSAGNTVAPLADITTCVGGNSTEVGPALLRPDGTVFATGANTCPGNGSGHTSIYYPNGGQIGLGFWVAGPDIPCNNGVCDDAADAPAGLLVDGNVLLQTSPKVNAGHSTFYEFELGSNKFSKPIALPSGFTDNNSEPGRMLAVPSGHLFYMHSGGIDEMWFYVPNGTYDPSWAPVIDHVTDNGLCVGCLNRGGTYTVTGTQLNGLSQGSAYGDDAQSASNYPLVLIENCASGKKSFARTHDFSTMGVATGLLPATAQFTVSSETELGLSKLTVITNGIPSYPYMGQCFFNVLGPAAN